MIMDRKEITLTDLKTIQMDVLSAIDDYCRDNNIRYSLACGSLLGAIRHKGYIPWDDDIDIYVPRDDYKVLMANFPHIYKDRYEIISLERNPQWEIPFAKAFDNFTVFEEYSTSSLVIGVGIDIFPIDDVPNGDEWLRYDKKRRILQKLFALKFVRVSKSRSLIKNFSLVLFRLLSFFYSKRRWAEYIDVFSQRYNGKGCEYCFECCKGLLQKQPFKKNLFDNLTYIPFEDRRYQAFSDADSYLRNGFGDYMQLPPEEKRVTHHRFTAYWK